jgi:hypothetical protein
MAIFEGSRYENTSAYAHLHPTAGLVVLLGRRKITEFPKDAEFLYYEYKEGDTIDYLAYKLYGDPHYWWVIMDSNTKYYVPWDIKVGDVLKVPTPETLGRVLNGI